MEEYYKGLYPRFVPKNQFQKICERCWRESKYLYEWVDENYSDCLCCSYTRLTASKATRRHTHHICKSCIDKFRSERINLKNSSKVIIKRNR